MATGAMASAGRPTGQPLETKITVKIIISTIAWLTCGTGVIGRWLAKWSLARVSIIALAGFVVVVAYLVISVALS